MAVVGKDAYIVDGESCCECGGTLLYMDKYDNLYQVVCDCNTSTPELYKTPEKALREWNDMSRYWTMRWKNRRNREEQLK